LYFERHISPDSVPGSRIIDDGPFNDVRHGVPNAILKLADFRRLGAAQA